jgi:hypothetical protein
VNAARTAVPRSTPTTRAGWFRIAVISTAFPALRFMKPLPAVPGKHFVFRPTPAEIGTRSPRDRSRAHHMITGERSRRHLRRSIGRTDRTPRRSWCASPGVAAKSQATAQWSQ